MKDNENLILWCIFGYFVHIFFSSIHISLQLIKVWASSLSPPAALQKERSLSPLSLKQAPGWVRNPEEIILSHSPSHLCPEAKIFSLEAGTKPIQVTWDL